MVWKCINAVHLSKIARWWILGHAHVSARIDDFRCLFMYSGTLFSYARNGMKRFVRRQ
jgi:hypothetical protein